MSQANQPEVVSFEYEYLENGIYMILGLRNEDGTTTITFINKPISAADRYTDGDLLAIALAEVAK